MTVEYFESENAGLSKNQVVNEIKNFRRAEGKTCNFVGDSITANINYDYDKVVSARFHPYVPFAMSTSSDKTARLWIPDKY